MGKRWKYLCVQRWHWCLIDKKNVHEIRNLQGNANKYLNEILPHPRYNGDNF